MTRILAPLDVLSDVGGEPTVGRSWIVHALNGIRFVAIEPDH
ncbi:hypothetical protein CLV49_2226 [Labedella gwakjiensis]|uniref:Uncharacterized protein n=1 Tax=Labedella gwakjiensis TaxID=390269 RepID=A0A2P8GXC7_9MICO|nr:hypothetical protein CLV49_2226 [Labedella gwakjiensis]